jgi:hypothetical protein
VVEPTEEAGVYKFAVFGFGVEGRPERNAKIGELVQIPRIRYETDLGTKRNYTMEFTLTDIDTGTNQFTLDYKLWFGYSFEVDNRKLQVELTSGEYLDQDTWRLDDLDGLAVYPAIIGADLAEDSGMRISSVGYDDGDLILVPKGTEGSSGGAIAEDIYLKVIGVFVSSQRRDNSNIYATSTCTTGQLSRCYCFQRTPSRRPW